MPYKSDSQRRYFHAAESRGEISPKVVHEFDQASKGKKLPERVKMSNGGLAQALKKKMILEKRKKMWLGGEVETSNPDSDEVLRHNSSGEPHTNQRLQSESDMEYDGTDKLSDYGIDSKYSGSTEETAGNYPRGGHGKQPNPYETPQDHEEDPNFVAKMFSGGMVGHYSKKVPQTAPDEEQPIGIKKMFSGGGVGESNYPVAHSAVDEEDFPISGSEHPANSNYPIDDATNEYDPYASPQDEEEDANFAHGGEVKSRKEFAMHLKKKMRGY